MTTVEDPRRSDEQAPEDDEELLLSSSETRPAGRWQSAAMPTERSKNFGAALRRLARMLGAEWAVIAVIAVFAIVSAIANVLGPRVLGHGTDIIVRGG